jgi:hypothetical protein
MRSSNTEVLLHVLLFFSVKRMCYYYQIPPDSLKIRTWLGGTLNLINPQTLIPNCEIAEMGYVVSKQVCVWAHVCVYVCACVCVCACVYLCAHG